MREYETTPLQGVIDAVYVYLSAEEYPRPKTAARMLEVYVSMPCLETVQDRDAPVEASELW